MSHHYVGTRDPNTCHPATRYGQQLSRPVRSMLVSTLVAVCLLAFGSEAAQSQTRYSESLSGGATIFGNSWFFKDGTETGTPGIPGSTVSTQIPQEPDVDADGSTHHSTYADLVLPPGSTIELALLYVEAALHNLPAAITSVRFRAPGDPSYTLLDASSPQFLEVTGPLSDGSQMIFDVTDLVDTTADYSTNPSGGVAGRYYLADLAPHSLTQNTNMGGWSIIVVYSNPSSPPRNVTVFDAWNFFLNQTVNVDVNGVLVPSSGVVQATVGATGTYGDRGYADRLDFGLQGGALTALADPFSGSTTDALNSSIAWASALLT